MLFGKKKEEPAVQPVQEIPEPQPQEPEVKEPEKFVPMGRTMIGSGITFFGNFETEDPMEINGTLVGNIKSSSSVNVAEGAKLHGDAEMKELESHGNIDGNIVVSGLSTFSETAVTDGTLSTRFLDSKHGSAFLGKLDLSGNRTAKAAEAPLPNSFEEPSFDADAFAQAAEELQGFVSESPAQGEDAPAESFDWHPEGSENA